MDEREMFEAWAATLDLDLTPIAGGHYSDCNTDFAWLAWSAARRTTPDRESIIEECAKVCEMERDALRKNEAIWDAYPNLRPDEEYISEWESSACRGEEYAKTIRALKTTSTAASTEES
ncbi:hypothetical protein [Burkholderia multivorans]|uniref:Putative phage protein n=1 Tax=Burkholderia multivorans CGD2 TaxID=513052 RepID=B9BX96_9BURK|nr:hypothetical protein [Burkholderia multivorans]EEE04606.1 putative phage protein [Burkholderia multivorans CGD2]EEE11140.1 putative phage protein [Burkholderia multivorans CGD2M]